MNKERTKDMLKEAKNKVDSVKKFKDIEVLALAVEDLIIAIENLL